ncbi:unnamed protein product [Nezara viridula]|uniref:Uncharacterized protein n=1 Tax=Nezara viridula TaxID=85310 RepID=A0A9P0GZ12_NEZVI|nr:unnamed protein product [Nezara viridula]
MKIRVDCWKGIERVNFWKGIEYIMRGKNTTNA